MSTGSHERRDFSRIPFAAEAHIQSADGHHQTDCQVIDISLNGVLIARQADWQPRINAVYEVELQLSDGALVIDMQQARIAHIGEQTVGFACELIDVDSITHLKRLVELNLGDEGLLHRELSALFERH